MPQSAGVAASGAGWAWARTMSPQAARLSAWIESRAHRVPTRRVRRVMRKSPTPQKVAARTPKRIPKPALGDQDPAPGLSRHAGLGREDAFEVQRIGRRERELGPRAPTVPAQAPHQLHRLGLRVLLAREALHETAAAHLAAKLPKAIDAHEIPPGNRDALALQHAPEDDAVAIEQT